MYTPIDGTSEANPTTIKDSAATVIAFVTSTRSHLPPQYRSARLISLIFLISAQGARHIACLITTF